ncbi:Hypothetical protein POVR1_LOCUS567 [uncultured virus]|nr:Hypothetical protein POVR1_LOCUS567 [uncultured virus]
MSIQEASIETIIAGLRNGLFPGDDDPNWGLAVELKSELSFLKPHLDKKWYKKVKIHHKMSKQAPSQLILRYRVDNFYICIECYTKKSSKIDYPEHEISIDSLRDLVRYLRYHGYIFYDQRGKIIHFE